jgi:hypothetical protein
METIELELDENGSPVTLEAAAWYVSCLRHEAGGARGVDAS